MVKRMAEVAEYAGVSEATVSRVLNGKPGVAESTRAAVLSAMDVLGYERPRPLRGRANRLVGLVAPDLSNPVFPAFAEVIGSALAQRGFTPVLCTRTFDRVSESDYVDMLLEHQISGAVFICGLHSHARADHSHYGRLLERGLPVVAVNGMVDTLPITCVSSDDELAARLAVRHLASLGHRRIGLALGEFEDHLPAMRKETAFRKALAEHCAVPDADDLVTHTMYTAEGGAAAAGQLVARGATALVCGSDLMALGAVRACQRMGLEVPDDISVVGYDDLGVVTLTNPPLTTVRQPIEAMGKAVVTLLGNRVNGLTDSEQEFLFEPELVVRGSTAAARPRTA
ncbi:LacI family transcriptional regulator [Wenjunlia vitaminophila]|uniref:LacI family transcriptional regulator n=1 Tax=Wenjunlia vitaminophila TaxID=76728 RepID=A0A0T6LP03_WENVI|nr:LacI family DNA-binding transcriptional regulator [Wenjunlia vitaminophila]KRV47831.1 LacI family transcriptional regulator [Wenjunlia vitaminophila]